MLELPLLDCHRCELRAGCEQVVWSVGPPQAKLMVVDEHPRSEDELMGQPFASRAGLHFKNLMRRAGLDPEECVLSFAVKCLPRKKGHPNASHANACKGWLWEELKKVTPKVVLSLGSLTTRMLLGLKKSANIGSVAGVVHRVPYMEALVVPWYSPTHVLTRGKKVDLETITLLTKVLEISSATD